MSKIVSRIAVLVCLVFSVVNSAVAEGTLFDYMDDNSTFDAPDYDRATISRDRIKFNPSALQNNLKFKLPNGKIVRVRLEKRKRSTMKQKFETITYRGYLKESSRRRGSFQLSVTNDGTEDAINGMIRTRDGEVWLLKQRSKDVQEVVQIDESQQIECTNSPKQDVHIPHGRIKLSNEVSIKADSTISLLVAYTPDALETAGGEANVQNLITTMVANANLAHANSKTGITYSLVGIHPLSTRSTDDFAGDLSAATNSTDGKWDELKSLREEYCADQVSVIVGGTNGQMYCGIGWLGSSAENMPYYKDSMYTIVSANQTICSYLTFVHELGHNLGSAHDYDNSGNTHTSAYPYSFGYRFTGLSGSQYRTVMAYAPGTRVPYFSNPSVNYDGVPTGTSSANNAASLALTGPVVSQFYGTGLTCGNHNPVPVSPITQPGTNPGGVPTTLPSTEPDAVSLSAKTKNKQTTFTVKTLSSGIAVGRVPVSIYYDKTGFGGFNTYFAGGNTNGKGVKKVTKKRKKGFYVACYSSTCSDVTSN